MQSVNYKNEKNSVVSTHVNAVA